MIDFDNITPQQLKNLRDNSIQAVNEWSDAHPGEMLDEKHSILIQMAWVADRWLNKISDCNSK